MLTKFHIKPIDRVLIVALAVLVLVTAGAIIFAASHGSGTEFEEEIGDITIYGIEQRIQTYELSDNHDESEPEAIRSDMLSYIDSIQGSFPDYASAGRVILSDFLVFQKNYTDAIDILESDLQYEVPSERRYIVYARLIDIYEHIRQPQKEKVYLDLLLAMEDVHPQYESWDSVKEIYQEKYDNLELINE